MGKFSLNVPGKKKMWCILKYFKYADRFYRASTQAPETGLDDISEASILR